MNKIKTHHIVAITFTPLIIFFYFLQWKNLSIHDDDLNVLRSYETAKGFFGKINLAVADGIFRPVQGLAIFILKETIHYNLNSYYLFNVVIQSISTLLFARVLNLFLKSPYISFILGFTLGLSRFCYYNMTQLYGGGALEGLAMIFFLLFLFSILSAQLSNNDNPDRTTRQILYGLLFANLCIYTHERYLVLFPFLILVTVFAPTLRAISIKIKTVLILLSVGSFCLPLLIRHFVFSIPVFMGTGYTDIKISIPTVAEYFFKAVISIFQINPGPEYLTGITFPSLSNLEKAAILFLLGVLVVVLVTYLLRIKSIITNETSRNRLFIFFSLVVLFGLLLGPALIQVRVELRWLQASFAVLVLLTTLIISEILSLNNKMKTIVLTGISILFALTNYVYLTKGAMNLYFSTSARVGAAFDQAIKNGTIHKNATKLYFWEKHRIAERENEINWALMGGYFFKLYQPGIPQIIYLDSVYQKSDSGFVFALPNFSKDSQQVILLRIENDNQTFKYYLSDITNEYLRDSLRSFKE